MTESRPADPYHKIEIVSEDDFKLIGFDEARDQEFGVPLHFNKMAGFILLAHLYIDRPYWQSEIRNSREFAEVAWDRYTDAVPQNRFAYQFSRLRFMFEALNSTLFLERGYGATQVLWRNPTYEVIDKRD